jgi:hypothetical protein
VIRIPMTFCSFCDDERNLGIVVLDGTLNAKQAADRATELGINPGGEVLTLPVPSYMPEALYLVHFENRNRVIPIEEAAPMFDLGKVENPASLPVTDDQWFDQGEPN